MKTTKIMGAIGSMSDRHIGECLAPPADSHAYERKGLSFSPALVACFSAVMCVAIAFAAYFVPKGLGIAAGTPMSSAASEGDDSDSHYIRFECRKGFSDPIVSESAPDGYGTEFIVCYGSYNLESSALPGIPMVFVSPRNSFERNSFVIDPIGGELICYDSNKDHPDKDEFLHGSGYSGDVSDLYYFQPILGDDLQPQEMKIYFIIHCENNIVGAAEIEITCDDNNNFHVDMTKTAEFTIEDGEYTVDTQQMIYDYLNGNS